MTLYLYKTGTNTSVLTIENAVSYTDNEAEENGTVYGPFAEGCELSSKPDCSEALRTRWRREHPSPEERMEELEAVLREYPWLTEEKREARPGGVRLNAENRGKTRGAAYAAPFFRGSSASASAGARRESHSP